MFWLSYECFSILRNAFLLKSAISSHNSCGLVPSFSCQNEKFFNTSKILWKNTEAVTKCSMKKACNFIKKETLAQVFTPGSEFCQISNNIRNFTEHLCSGWLILKIEITLVLIAGFNPGQTWVLFS